MPEPTKTLEIEVRNPNARITAVTPALVAPGAKWSHAFRPLGVAGSNRAMAEVVVFRSVERAAATRESSVEPTQSLDDRTPHGQICANGRPIAERLRVAIMQQREMRTHRGVAVLLLQAQPRGHRPLELGINPTCDEIG